MLFAKRLGSCPPQGQSQHSCHLAPQSGRGRLTDACHLVSLGDLRGWFWAPLSLAPGDPPVRPRESQGPDLLSRRRLGSGQGGLVI